MTAVHTFIIAGGAFVAATSSIAAEAAPESIVARELVHALYGADTGWWVSRVHSRGMNSDTAHSAAAN
jgi:hypothetical protein